MNIQEYYKGFGEKSLYYYSTMMMFNSYQFDIIKRISRYRKGNYIEDLLKTIGVIEIWKKERVNLPSIMVISEFSGNSDKIISDFVDAIKNNIDDNEIWEQVNKVLPDIIELGGIININEFNRKADNAIKKLSAIIDVISGNSSNDKDTDLII